MERLKEIRRSGAILKPIDGLIGTKVRIPPLKTRMVERGHLLDRLSRARDSRLIVISGIAASGKTSLASRWIIRDELPAAWYSLDRTDNDTNLFLRYLLASLSSADSTLAAFIRKDLQAGKTFAEKHIVSQLIRRVSQLPGEVYLFLDDYHSIASRTIHNTVAALLSRMPANMHVIIMTRYAIPFPLSPFRVRDQIVEISASDMRFTEEETGRFFSEIMPVRITVDEARRITSRMEGWVGGLQLFGLSLKDKETPGELVDLLNNGNQKVSEYLIDEIIGVQPPKIRAFLEATVPLDRFSAETAQEITGTPDTREIIDTIRRNNLLIIPLDAEHNWYRYHQLLSEAVKGRIRSSAPGRLAQIHQKAALWFARNGYLEDAFRNAFASKDPEFAADLLEDYLLFINDRHEYASGRRWLAELPHDVFMRRTLLRLHDCGQKVDSFQLSDIEAVIRGIEVDPAAAFAGYQGDKRRLCEDLFTYFRYALYYYYRDPVHPNLEELEEAASMISPQNRLFSGYMKILIALGHASQGRPLEAERALAEASPIIISSGRPWARVLWFREYATVQRMQGRLNRSEAVLREAFEFLELRGISETPLRYVLYLPMGWLHYQRNDLERASEYAAAAARYGEHVRFARDMAESNLLLSLIHKASGAMKEAEDCLHKVRLITEERGVSDTGVSAEPWIARLSMVHGDIRFAVEWSGGKDFLVGDTFTGQTVHEFMAYIELLIHQRMYLQADEILKGLRNQCVERNMMKAVLDIDIAQSAVACGLKSYEQAGQILRKALAFAEIEGYVRPFLDFAPHIFPLLSEMKRTDLGPRLASHLRTIMNGCNISGKGLVGSTKRFEEDRSRQLTRREIEVLKLMAAGRPYREIAKKTFVSFETVKTHVKHIFEKLDVDSRGRAVRRAQDLRLLDS
jgi:LuxR family transcriptional regulator, maltose regulon positive regulatory protein